MNIDKILKTLTIGFFLVFIFSIPIYTFFSEDKKVSEIENKILAQKPNLTLSSIKSKRFMDDFNSYVSDQFPYRVDFIKFKNSATYLLGNREFREIYLTRKNTLMQKFTFNKSNLDNNLLNIYNQSKDLNNNYNIDSSLILVPTSIGIYEDLLPSWAITDNQENTFNYISEYISDLNKNNKKCISFYTPYYVLKKYKDYPIYFNTDHHWTQLGARITYEDFYNKNINIESIVNKDYSLVSDNFYGSFYSKAILNQIKPDSIYSYDKFNNNSIEIDFTEKFTTLYDKDLLKGKNKYQYFLHGDPGYALIEGQGIEEVLVFKDSYAHAFIPFLTQNYKKIHVVDPRYYKFDVSEYLKNNPNISEIIYLYNLQTFNSDPL